MTQVSVAYNALMVPGPDGKMHVGLQLGAGPLSLMLTMPADVVDDFMAAWSQQAAQVAADARRQNTGLLMPADGVIPPAFGGNGRHTRPPWQLPPSGSAQ